MDQSWECVDGGNCPRCEALRGTIWRQSDDARVTGWSLYNVEPKGSMGNKSWADDEQVGSYCPDCERVWLECSMGGGWSVSIHGMEGTVQGAMDMAMQHGMSAWEAQQRRAEASRKPYQRAYCAVCAQLLPADQVVSGYNAVDEEGGKLLIQACQGCDLAYAILAKQGCVANCPWCKNKEYGHDKAVSFEAWYALALKLSSFGGLLR